VFTDYENKITQYNLIKKIGTIVPYGDNSYAVALQDGIYHWFPKNNQLRLIANPEKNIKGNRYNDGKVDINGRLWVGSMSMSMKPNKGALYKLESTGKYKKMIDSVSVSNGIVWNSLNTNMYYIDSPTRKIIEYTINSKTGTISNPKVAIQIPDSLGFPDGMTIDSDDHLWIALWNGYAVTEWNPISGQLLSIVNVPAKNVTSCAFGGSNLDTLYITTARSGMSANELIDFPQSGSVFCCPVGSTGVKTNYFGKINQ